MYALTVKFENYDRYTAALELLNSPAVDALTQAKTDIAQLQQRIGERIRVEQAKCSDLYEQLHKAEMENAELQHDLAGAKAEIELHRRKAADEYWVWQGDGSDHPESLACPVLMHQEDLRKMLAEIERLNKALLDTEISRGEVAADAESLENDNAALKALLSRTDICVKAPCPRKLEAEAEVDALKARIAELEGHVNSCPLTRGCHDVSDLYEDDAALNPQQEKPHER